MVHHGSCHCGKVAFDVEGEVDGALACNCSICARRGSLPWFVPHQRLQLRTAPEDLASYTFNKHVIQHRFCPTCGVQPFGLGTDPAGNAIAAVNVRCIEGIDLGSLKRIAYDGRSKL